MTLFIGTIFSAFYYENLKYTEKCKELCLEHPYGPLPTINSLLYLFWASQVALVVKNPPANAGDIRDPGSIPG